MLAVGAYAKNGEPKPYQSGLLQSQEPFKYGRFETLMKASSAKGTESIFALVNDDMFQNQEEWNSISIVPSFSRQNSIVNTNMSVMMLDEGIQHYEITAFPEDVWHTYAIEWTPDYLSYIVDGKEIRRRVFGDDPYDID